jgi:hypothetical protein
LNHNNIFSQLYLFWFVNKPILSMQLNGEENRDLGLAGAEQPGSNDRKEDP